MSKKSSVKDRCFTRNTIVELLQVLHRDGLPDPRLLLEERDQEFLSALPNIGELRVGDPGDFADDLLFCSLISKADFLNLGVDRAAVALEGFLESESSCRRVNLAIHHCSTLESSGIDTRELIRLVRWKISSVLRDDFDWDEFSRRTGFGPGANVGVPRARSRPDQKVAITSPTSTSGCESLARTVLKWFDLWGNHLVACGGDLEIVPGNRIVTVPKNAKTDRVIAVEPLMNSFCQRSIGRMIRSRLRRVGVNLHDQGHNQFLAAIGSVRGSLATLDLSRASDSLAREVVQLVVPSDWYSALEMCRSPRGVSPSGTYITYEKFSSMGNGYTFELESLLFWAVLSVARDLFGARDDVISVYGDDLIVPSHYADNVREMLGCLGFELNASKSYSSAELRYRESCGKHFLGGVEVTPFYIREDVEGVHRRVWLANEISRWAFRRRGCGWSRDGRFQSIWSKIVATLPTRAQQSFIPDGYGDGALVGDFCEAVPEPSIGPRGWEGWVTSHMVALPRKRRLGGFPYLVALLLEAASQNTDGTSDESDAQWRRKFDHKSFRRVRRDLLVAQWQDLGPWI